MTQTWKPVEQAILNRVEKLRLKPRKKHAGRLRGERLSPRKGVSIEFADYRHYTDGDDLRHLDWNIYARLNRANIRTYRDEEELPVYLLLDATESMSFGEPSKCNSAKTYASCVGYSALVGSDAVYAVNLAEPINNFKAIRGKASYRKLLNWLMEVEPNAGNLETQLKDFARFSPRPGMVFLFSDCLEPQIEAPLREIVGRGHEVAIIQILSKEDTDPDLEGDLKLLDCESGNAVEITAYGAVMMEYKRNLSAHCKNIQEFCLKTGSRYVIADSSEPPEDVVLKRLRRTGALG